MKISPLPKHKNERGVALIVTLTFALLCGAVLSTYLVLISSDAQTVARSQNWNDSLAYAEAGVDEALAQINASPNDYSANSWGGTSGTGGANGPVTRTLSQGSYSVRIVGGLIPTIYSTGFVQVANSSQKVSRVVKVTAEQLGLLPVAFAALNNITLNGNGITSDSYNSHMTNLSTAGLYDPTKTSTNGNVASVDGVVNPGNHTITGSLYLGPTASYSGSQANVTGTIYRDYNIQFNPVVVPSGATPVAPTVVTTYTTNYDKHGNSASISPSSTTEYLFTSTANHMTYSINQNYPIEINPGVNVRRSLVNSTEP